MSGWVHTVSERKGDGRCLFLSPTRPPCGCTTPTPDAASLAAMFQHPDECSCPACDFVPEVAAKASIPVSDAKRHLASIARDFATCETCGHSITRNQVNA